MRAFLLSLLIALTSGAQTPEVRVEEIVQSYVTNHQFMGTVLIAKGDKVVFDNGYGSRICPTQSSDWGR
jgi:hypothetical protein